MKVKNQNPLTEEEKMVAAKKRAQAKKSAVDEELNKFSQLPDEAQVRVLIVARLYACSVASVWRHVHDKTKGIPKPRKFGSRMTAWNVGELRAALNA